MSGGTQADNGVFADLDHHWLRWTTLVWVVLVAWFVWDRWGSIHWLALSDTDDNLRLMQVRGLLNGQGWYDLRQYRLNPPGGYDIHWSRLVDLPIAGLILFFGLFTTSAWAERLACGIAPLLPLGVALAALGFTVRQLIAPLAWPLAVILLLGAAPPVLMFMPMRIDHHGWQLALLALTLAGLADPRAARGGAIVGGSSALSLTIGLEMLPYLAIAGAILTLRWVWDAGERRRLIAYALALSGGSALGFALFASEANQALRCDALTPVWLAATVAAGALLFGLAWLDPTKRGTRLVLAAIAGAALGLSFALLFPQCLTRPEGVSDELKRVWLDNVREAKPVYEHPLRSAFPILTLPVIGLLGAAFATWRARGSGRAVGWATVTAFTAFAVAMLFWQTRAGPAAALLAVPGAAALAWVILPWTLGHRLMPVRVLGTAAAFLMVSGLFAGLAIRYLPIDRPDARTRTVQRAGARCPTIPSLTPLNRLPPQTIFTFSDLGPRLITITHHSAVAGPYHRNGEAILDVHHAFAGSPAQFRAIARRHGATLLLTCPNMAESTVYRARNPKGFYARLAGGEKFAWLTPVPMPGRSPLRLWRIE